ncbi:MAG TPA: 5'-nucleotidase C-terminal domain-containing protein [Woeseiaceae bacterium]|nr:5'-nucleotidase C-terminal domain-containing protein [Woeseiaceae bacterium]
MKPFHCLPLVLAWLLCGCAPQAARHDVVPRVTLLHLNDTYRIDAVEDGTRGGFGRVTTLIRELRGEGRDVYLLHAGDFLYPSLESQLWDGAQMVEAFNFMNRLAPLYVVPGNHEFDPRSPAALVAAVRASEFEWIADNLQFRTGAADVDGRLRHDFIARLGPYRVGILGLTVHEADGGNDRGYAPVDRDYVARAEQALQAMAAADVDLVIGLTHLNIDEDRELAALKARFPRFQLIAGGHEHEAEFEPGDAGHATIIKGASNARTIWRIELAGNPAQGMPRVTTTRIAVDERIREDAAYGEISDRWRAELLERMPWLPAKIGVAALPLDGRETAVRNEETPWGDFIADRMRGAFGEPPADFAFVNGGTLRIDDYIAGDITFEDVGRTFGFSSFLRRMTLSGDDFRDLLEAGYRGSGASKGYFPQISGFRVCVDRSRPEGRRIVSLQVPTADGWADIDPRADYTLVAPDYLYGGGDGYDFSAAREVSPPGSELKFLVVDAIMNAQADGDAVGQPVDPDDPRIVIRNAGRRYCFSPVR